MRSLQEALSRAEEAGSSAEEAESGRSEAAESRGGDEEGDTKADDAVRQPQSKSVHTSGRSRVRGRDIGSQGGTFGSSEPTRRPCTNRRREVLQRVS